MTKCNKGNKLGCDVAVRANENERDHGERSRPKRKSMDIQVVSRSQKVGCRSGDARERTTMWTEFELKITADPVITEPVHRPPQLQ